MTAPAPSAQGQLAQTPLLHLLVYALDRGLSGTLVLEDPNGERHAIYFSSGVPIKARAAEPVHRLGELLIALGLVDEARIGAALEQARSERRLLGKVLVDTGALDVQALASALSEQVWRTIERLARLPGETAFGYYDALNYLERWGGPEGAPVSPFSLIWRLVREHGSPQQISSVLSRLGDSALRLHVSSPVSHFGFESRVQAVVDVLRAKPQPLAELIARDLTDAETVGRLIFTFALLRHLELPGAAPPIGLGVPEAGGSLAPPRVESPRVTPAQRASVPAERRTGPRAESAAPAAATSPQKAAELEAMRQEIRTRAENSTMSLYEVLGVPQDATASVIQGAFFQLAKAWHPDRLSSELDDVRDLATRLFARMSEANQVLTDNDRRREYDELLKKGGVDPAEHEQVQRVLGATTAYQKALVLLKRNSLDAAEKEARRALEGDPDQADYIGLLAWIEAAKPNPKLERLLLDLDRAVDMEDNNVRVRWYRGQLLKRMGKESRALSDFRSILEHDPKHVDAQREVRLFEMRRGAGGKSEPAQRSGGESKDKASTSMFGRLFKKP